MTVVSDTSPISYLVLIGREGVTAELYEEFWSRGNPPGVGSPKEPGGGSRASFLPSFLDEGRTGRVSAWPFYWPRERSQVFSSTSVLDASPSPESSV